MHAQIQTCTAGLSLVISDHRVLIVSHKATLVQGGTSVVGYASSAPKTSAAASGRRRAPSQRSRSGSIGGVNRVKRGALPPLPAVMAARAPL